MSFFVIFTLIYFFLHAFVWARMNLQLGLSWRTFILGLLAALALALTPYLARRLPDAWDPAVVRVVWWAVYVWFAAIVYLFWLQLAALVLQILARLTPPAWLAWLPRGKAQLAAVVAATVLILIYGVWSANRWETPCYEITSPHIKREVRIALAADTHFGVIRNDAWVERLVAAVNDLHPDLILFAGDQLNDHVSRLAPQADILRKLQAPLGVYGVLGNHEIYVGQAPSLRFHHLAGVMLLRGETVNLPGTGVQISGVDDPALTPNPKHRLAQEIKALKNSLTPGEFHILVSHRPWLWPEQAARAGFDLQVSGHTHGGQLFPFSWLVRLQYPYVSGHFEADGSHLVVSRGAGTWGPPLRVGADAQIPIIVLKPER
jgi:hypothetical protein